MAIQPFSVDGAQIANSATTYLTADTGTWVRIDACALCNDSGGNETVTMHIVPSGGSAASSNKILDAYTVADGETYTPPGIIGQWLEPGATLQALASTAASVTLIVSGVKFTG